MSGSAARHETGRAPRVTVVMNCLNGAAYLREALDSVYAQTFSDWEIVFWDNGSTDATSSIAQSYDQRLRYFRAEITTPLGEARNLALAQARGEFIAFLDADDLWLPTRLAQQVPLLDARPGTDLVYANFYYLNEDGRRSVALRGEQPQGQVFARFLLRYPVGMLTVLLRHSAVKRLDELFDPAFQISEEYDLFMRLLYHSHAAYVDAPLAVYRIHGGMATLALTDRAADEFDRALVKLRRIDEQRERAFGPVFEQAAGMVVYERAKLSLSRGELAEARRHVSGLKWTMPKAMVIHLASLLPRRLWFALRPLWARGTFR